MVETETSASRDRDADNFSRDETEAIRSYVSRPSRGRDVETETTTLATIIKWCLSGLVVRTLDL